MKVKYVKFSDERRKEFCIKTLILDDDGVIKVRKEAKFDEGKKHILDFTEKNALLKKNYDTRVCDVSIVDEAAEFEYVRGKTLESMYCDAMEQNDEQAFSALIRTHRQIIVGKDDNMTDFALSDKYTQVFGDGQAFVGKKALSCANYDAIASNIIYDCDEPVLIDYEWVYDFYVPADVVLYHCIHNLYEKNSGLNEFYPLERACAEMGIETDIKLCEQAYKSFYSYVIDGQRDDGYALVKQICLKDTKTLSGIEKEKEGFFYECIRLQEVIDDINKQLIECSQSKNNIERKYKRTIRGMIERLK